MDHSQQKRALLAKIANHTNSLALKAIDKLAQRVQYADALLHPGTLRAPSRTKPVKPRSVKAKL